MQKFKLPVTFTFTGTVTVEANSVQEAQKIAQDGFGMVCGESPHANDSRVCDWLIDTHPIKDVSSKKIS